MGFIYACDIHGDEYKYEKLYKIEIKQNLKYIVLGGDLLSKFGSNRYAEQLLFIQTFFNDYFTKLEEQDREFSGKLNKKVIYTFNKKHENLLKV